MFRQILTMGLGVILMANQFSCNDKGTGKVEQPNEVVLESAPSVMLLEAVRNGSSAEVEAILKQNTEDLNQKGPQGLTPLHIAAKEGYTRIVNLLITAGADINAQDQNGETPLHKAVIYDHPVVVKQLLNAGADANIQSKLGRPIYYAVRVLGNPQMIELLKDASIIPGRTELDPNIPVKKFEIDLNPSPPTSQQVENKTFKYRITDIPLDWELVTHQQDTFLVYKAISL